MKYYSKIQIFKVISVSLVIIILIPLSFMACSNPEPQPPWPNVKVYYNDSQKINLDSGDLFVIRYTTEDLFPSFKVGYDDKNIAYLEQISDNHTDLTKKTAINYWFLFKALKTGKTQIEIIHYTHLPEFVEAQKIFVVVIK